MSKTWNTADKTLLCSFFVFLMALGFEILYPDNIISEGVLFVAEAALVGGVADWFAVTALFEKPLGFPLHTALLPRRRQEFIEASVNMVQNEFFSRKSIFKKLSNLHLLPKILDYLRKPEIRNAIINLLFEEIVSFIIKLDKDAAAKKISNEIRKTLKDVPPNILIHEISQYLKKSGKDKVIFEAIIVKARSIAATEEARNKIENILEEYAGEHLQASSSFSMLMAGLAQALDLVNFEEAAELMQKYLLEFLDELTRNPELQQRVLEECRKIFSEVTDNIDFRDLIYQLQIDSVDALPIDLMVRETLISLSEKLSKSNKVGAFINDFLTEQFDRLINLLETNSTLKISIEKFIFDLVLRSALSARPIFANIAQNSLMKLSDEQLNSLVYGKAEEDFIWIRLNGSIVGSTIGLIVFIIIQCVSI